MTRAVAPPAGETVLGLEHVSVVLGRRQILNDVSFDVRAGDVTGLIGTNGAGKTTLFRAILGLQRPVSGTVSTPAGAGGRRAAIGYVPQKLVFDSDLPLRARDVIALGLDGHRLGVALPSRARNDRVDELLSAVGASEFAAARVGELSGGEQQRVLIAHALAGGPRVLLLDEPLANLDLRSATEVAALLARVASERGVGVLVSAHDMNPLLPVMSRIVYIASGRVAAGPIDEVVRPDVLSELYGHHVDVIRLHDRILVVAEVMGEPMLDHDDAAVALLHAREHTGR